MKDSFLYSFFYFFLLLMFLNSCGAENDAYDLVIYNGNIHTLDSTNSIAEAIAIKDGEIQKLGSSAEIRELDAVKTIDAKQAFVMPGFIEGHGHFSRLGYSLINLNFIKSKNWDEIVSMVEEKVKTAEPGEWIEGRGWHQEKWNESPGETTYGYPSHDKLSAISPDNPVILGHASGHGIFANAKAMEVAGVSVETPNPSGGRIVRDSDGEAIGVFEEKAMSVISEAHQEYLDGLSQDALKEKWHEGIRLAEEECLSKGVTSFQDAGSSFEECRRYETLAKDGELDVRLWVMVRENIKDLKQNIAKHRMVNVGDKFYTCRAIKSAIDGALGSYGAWLLQGYSDKQDFIGQNTTSVENVKEISAIASNNNMQYCVHAIGDRANREVLDIFSNFVSTEKNMRWRIEHAQHLHPDDIPRFAQLEIIPAMQGIHCTSDSPFVVKRLGKQRAQEGAYAWRSLMDSGAIIANGTDVPVEDVDPIQSYYASVTRKRADNKLIFFPMQKMSRLEALKSYTINNAHAAFEEEYKGTLEKGKVADIVILSENLMTCSDDAILNTKVLYTIVNGDIKYENI